MLNNASLTNILLLIVILMNIITMILVIVSMKKNKSSKSLVKDYQMAPLQVGAAADLGSGQERGYAVSGVVFCRSCGTQYDSANAACPVCKTAR